MNIFWRELKAHRKGLFFWCIGMIFMVGSGVAKFYGYTTGGNGQASAATEIYKMFPHSMQVLFGLNGFDLTKPSGAYGILFMYLVLMAVIHAVLLGTDLISKEERDKTSEFLFVKPISRAKAITAKLLAGLVNLVILNLVTLITSLYVVDYFSKSTTTHSDVVMLCSALFIMQLLFLLIGAAIASVMKRAKAAAGIATAILLITFVLYFAINLSGKIDGLRYFTPFKYFEAQTMLSSGHLDAFYVVLAAVLGLAALAITYFFYRRRDLAI